MPAALDDIRSALIGEELVSDEIRGLLGAVVARMAPPYYLRDVQQYPVVINGMEVDVYFTGDMSCGDAPGGPGWQLFDTLMKLGFASAFYAAIPWNEPSVKRGGE